MVFPIGRFDLVDAVHEVMRRTIENDTQLEVQFVPFETYSRPSNLWLQRVLEVNKEWFSANFEKLPLILEVKGQLQEFKATFASGSSRRLPRQHGKVLVINVRGMILMVKTTFHHWLWPLFLILQDKIEIEGP